LQRGGVHDKSHYQKESALRRFYVGWNPILPKKSAWCAASGLNTPFDHQLAPFALQDNAFTRLRKNLGELRDIDLMRDDHQCSGPAPIQQQFAGSGSLRGLSAAIRKEGVKGRLGSEGWLAQIREGKLRGIPRAAPSRMPNRLNFDAALAQRLPDALSLAPSFLAQIALCAAIASFESGRVAATGRKRVAKDHDASGRFERGPSGVFGWLSGLRESRYAGAGSEGQQVTAFQSG
jgi:hypothetical protein